MISASSPELALAYPRVVPTGHDIEGGINRTSHRRCLSQPRPTHEPATRPGCEHRLPAEWAPK
jgi:hypothetical protein